MRRTTKIAAMILIATVSLAANLGCRDGVRQTLTPYLFSGLQTIGQDLAGNLSSTFTPTTTVGIQSIVQGLLAGLEHHIYPEGGTSTPIATARSSGAASSSGQ